MLIKKSSSVSEQVSTLSVPDAARLKAELVRQMAIIIEEKSLTRRVIAELLGFNQPQVSMMLRGQVQSYTVEQLADFLSILNGRSPQEQPSQTQTVTGDSDFTTAKANSSDQVSAKTTVTAPEPLVTAVNSSDELLLKTEIVQKISKVIEENGMSQRSVGELLGFSQPQVSLMLRCRVNAYSIEQLSGYLEILKGQELAVVAPATAQQSAVAPPIAVDDVPVSVPTGQIELNESLAEVMEEIAYLRQHLALVGRSDSPQERLRQQRVMQAEVELLRSENALLREKTERFERMTELLQLA